MTARSPLVTAAVAEIREYVALLEYLAKSGKLDAKSALDGLSMISDSVDEIEQVAGPSPDLGHVVPLPVMTLADVACERATKPAFGVIQGGRS